MVITNTSIILTRAIHIGNKLSSFWILRNRWGRTFAVLKPRGMIIGVTCYPNHIPYILLETLVMNLSLKETQARNRKGHIPYTVHM
jgi:hypothetical protein